MSKRGRVKKPDNKSVIMKKTIIEQFSAHKKDIMVALGLCTPLYPIVNEVYEIIYQRKCETFYGLPGKYFSANVDNTLLYLGSILIFLFICIVPLFMIKYDEKRDNSTKLYLVFDYIVDDCIRDFFY